MWSSGRRERKGKLRLSWGIMAAPCCPAGPVTTWAQCSSFLPHASLPGCSGQATHSAFHELHLLPIHLCIGWVHWGSHGNPPFHQAAPSSLGRMNG